MHRAAFTHQRWTRACHYNRTVFTKSKIPVSPSSLFYNIGSELGTYDIPLRRVFLFSVFHSEYFQTSQIRADSRFAPSQWETALQSNAVSHWLGANLKSALPGMQVRAHVPSTCWVRCQSQAVHFPWWQTSVPSLWHQSDIWRWLFLPEFAVPQERWCTACPILFCGPDPGSQDGRVSIWCQSDGLILPCDLAWR